MMRLFFILGWLLASTTDIEAQEWQPRWITHPYEKTDKGIWFRYTFALQDEEVPAKAEMVFSSSGWAEVYLNGWNISTELPSPNTEYGMWEKRYDIGDFLQSGINEIIVEYFPQKAKTHTEKQLSMTLWGQKANGSTLCVSTNTDWLCKESDRRWTEKGMLQDGRRNRILETGEQTAILQWIGAEKGFENTESEDTLSEKKLLSPHLCLISEPERFDKTEKGIVYDFGIGFYGLYRATLRGMQRGDTLTLGNLSYICNGENDEQAFTKFIPTFQRTITAKANNKDLYPIIQKIEALEIKENSEAETPNGTSSYSLFR